MSIEYDWDTIKKDALLSECGTYRYWLTRMWDASLPVLAVVMLNPSTADAEVDDPTIKLVIKKAMAAGFGGIRVVNLFAYRATKPKDMKAAEHPIGLMNDAHIVDTVRRRTVLCAWGAHGHLYGRASEVYAIIQQHTQQSRIKCIGGEEWLTKSREPRHPLFMDGSLKLERYVR